MSSSVSSADPVLPAAPTGDVARLIAGSRSWADRWIDRLNPIFVKETRQAVKSKQFLGSFLMLLLVSWLISLIAISAAGQSLDYGDWGRELFACYFVVLAAAILVVVPFTAFRSLMSEREEATFEPLVISTLSPRQIVLGKLYSAMLQAFLYYAAIAPFMAFTALLQGFDIAYVALLLTLGLGASAWATIAALAISAMVHGRMWQTIVSLVVLGQLLAFFGTAWGLAFESWWMRWSDPWVVAGLVVWVLAGLATIVLLQEIAVANLTFHADNRSTGLRLIVQGQFVLIWVCVGSSIWYLGGTYTRAAEELITVGIILSMLLWTVAGLFFVTETEELSQRIVRKLPQRAVVRLATSPYYPGGHRGLVLSLGNLLLISLILAGYAVVFAKTMSDDEVIMPLASLLYAMIYLGFASALSRWALSWSATILPLHCRVASLVMIALSMTAPLFFLVFDDYRSYNDYSLLYITNPVMTLEHLDRNGVNSEAILIVLLVGVLATMALNLPAMARGLFQMVQSEPLPPPTTAD